VVRGHAYLHESRRWQLGTASCYHIATRTSFGGGYVEDFTREGNIAGVKARCTCAARDKIFVELSSGDHLMGEDIEPNAKCVSQTWTDSEPLKGENRYYLRIEQSVGNMTWSSPLWITLK
jgi:hypothetical protein